MHFLRSLLPFKRPTLSSEAPTPCPNCFGRERLLHALVEGTANSGCVLLFGGRQSGKTTVLRAVERDLATNVVAVGSNCCVRLPVYVDLMRLHYDATPVDFFDLLYQRAISACTRQIRGFKSAARSAAGSPGSVDRFISQLTTVRQSVEVDINFVFLIDEAKRVLTSRFPRGFQDNLFSLMFGSASGPYSFVLTGAQELYKLCEDSTSPIGSRAVKTFVSNLSLESVGDLIRSFQPQIEEMMSFERQALVFHQTAGHAGLSADLAYRFAKQPNAPIADLDKVVASARLERSDLFQMWMHGFSPEALVIIEVLLVTGRMTVSNMAAVLRAKGLPPYRADRVSEELQFTGIAVKDGEVLVSANTMYIETARNYLATEVGTDREQELWALIRETETGLRRLIRKEFEHKWPGSSDDQIRKRLGEKSWSELAAMRERNEKSYSATPRKVTEVLECAYLGQLGELMKSNASWHLFQGVFRDKRELEDMLRDIMPVRNDFAHFRTAPERELDRCRIRCEDLLAIMSRLGDPP